MGEAGPSEAFLVLDGHSVMHPESSTTGNGQKQVMRKSCQYCRKRKIRCIEAEEGEGSCKACLSKKQECVFEMQSVMGRPPKSKKRDADAIAAESAPKQSKKVARTVKEESSKSPSSSSDGVDAKGKRRKNSASASKAAPRLDGASAYSDLASSSGTSSAPVCTPTFVNGTHQMHAAVEQAATHTSGDLKSARPMSLTGIIQHVLPVHTINASASQMNGYPEPSPVLPSPVATASASRLHYYPLERSIPPASGDNVELQLYMQRIQRDGDLYQAFRSNLIVALASAFYETYSSRSASRSPSPFSFVDPTIPGIAKTRVLYGKALAARKANIVKKAATAEYARSLIKPLWEGLPVDIISLVTTGKPSASGPFALTSNPESSKDKKWRAGGPEEYLFAKLLTEDESTTFELTRPTGKDALVPLATANSPHIQFTGNNKQVIAKYFQGYYNGNPLAPLLINEKIFLDDVMNDCVDDLLLNVIIGAVAARGLCYGQSADARDVGESFFSYVAEKLLRMPVEACLKLETCQALFLWGAHEVTHMRQRRACALWSTVEVLLRERIRRFEAAQAAIRKDPTGPHQLSQRDYVEYELTNNALWILNLVHTWASISLKLPGSAMSVFTSNLQLPPNRTATSASFQYSFSSAAAAKPLSPQFILRKAVERFSDVVSLVNVIIAVKDQAHARYILAPDPAKPLSMAPAGEDAHIANWLLELANHFSISSRAIIAQTPDLSPEDSKAFLVVAHACLALYQVMPYVENRDSTSTPPPLPAVQTLKTAMSALHLLASSFTSASTQIQGVLLNALPRIVSVLEMCTTASLDSLDHFILITSHRDMLQGLLHDLTQATLALERNKHISVTSSSARLQQAATSLMSIANLGSQVNAATPSPYFQASGVFDIPPTPDAYTNELPNPFAASNMLPGFNNAANHPAFDFSHHQALQNAYQSLPVSLTSSSSSSSAGGFSQPAFNPAYSEYISTSFPLH